MRHLDEHLDDGIIHALLDGELSGEELAAARAHVLACEACSARVAEERLLAGEAERLIAELDEAGTPGAAGSVPPPPQSPTVKGPPVVLIPQVAEEEPSRWQRRRGPSRWVGIAATIAIAAGAGIFALQGAPESDTFGSDSVVSDMEPLPAPEARGLALTDSGVTPAAPDSLAAAPIPLAAETSAARLDTGAPAEGLVPVPETRLADAAPAETRRSADANPPALKARDEAASVNEARDQAAERPAGQTPTQERAERTVAPQSQPAGDAEIASVMQMRPGVTTGAAAAAPPSRRRDSLRVPAAPTASIPAPRRPPLSLEQQSQISMRIGLDEAQRLLGSPMHVIDGLQPEFVGLVPGRLVSGANPNDYVVRVVYLDDQRRKIYLDQQRLDLTGRQMGMQRDTVPPQWVKGEVRLSLSGDISAESARALARRVR
ncbi:MAG TPA: zf-HC2 domain-containing protein [Gemmatimonadales bacterium]|nr:zf-HC2 domain-containing protein [Gemmatimonadales bacterium]